MTAKEFFNLSNKHILVTGASSGIGRATAQLLSKLGAKVALIARNPKNLRSAFDSLHGDGHSYHINDLNTGDEIFESIRTIAQEEGPFDGLFHAAGIFSIQPLQSLKCKKLDAVFDISIKATLMLAKAFCYKEVRNKGDISLVFMSSVAGLRGQQGLSTYSAGKAAIDGAVRSLAVELAPRKMRINSIAAGAIKTEMHEKIVKHLTKEQVEEYERRHLLGFGYPEDVANAATFLLSDASKWITGITLIVDGGYSCY